MPVRRQQRSIRFSADEWTAVTEAANRNDMTPGEFVREAATHAAAEKIGLGESRLTPALVELLKRTFRGVHILTYLKRRELSGDGSADVFQEAADAARTAQDRTIEISMDDKP